MNTDIITINECNNDGKTIHVYYQPISGAWFAYGFSAFLLKNLCQYRDIQALESYSKEMQMPCVFVIDIVDVAQNVVSKYPFDNHCIINIEKQAVMNDYTSWAKSLRNKLI